MGKLLDLVTPLHSRTQRDYLKRMLDDKVHCMQEARKYERNYWDGERRYGYGGYQYQPGRWKPVAQALIERYALKPSDAVLDLGCGKGFLLYEMQLLMPGLRLVGMDRSKWAIDHRHPDFKGNLIYGDFRAPFTCGPKHFDLVISLGALHNMRLFELAEVLPEIERIGKNAYVMVESFRNEREWFNLVCWCLTAEAILRPEDWIHLFKFDGYSGDYEFIYFE